MERRRFTAEFKREAVKLSSLPGVLIKDVAEALDIHPFMLSLWRKEVCDGVIVAKGAKLDVQTNAELKRLKELERQNKMLRAARVKPQVKAVVVWMLEETEKEKLEPEPAASARGAKRG